MKKYTTYELSEKDLQVAVQEYLSRKDIFIAITDIEIKITPNGDIIGVADTENELE